MNFDHDKIEAYVFGRLGEEERAAFQFALLRDGELRREVEAVRVLRGVARAKAKKAKRGRLLFFYPKQWVRVAAVFIGVLTLGALIAFFSREKKQDFVKKDNQIPTEQKQDFKEQPIVDDNEGEMPQPEIKDSTKSDIVKTPLTPQKAPAPSPKIKTQRKKSTPDIPQKGIANSPADNKGNDNNAPIFLKDDDSNESLTFRDSFQFIIDIGGFRMASTSSDATEFEGKKLNIHYAPQDYYVVRLPKYPAGIYFEFTSDYPTGKNSKHSKVLADLVPNPILEQYYESQKFGDRPIKLIGKSDTTNTASMTCFYGTLGKSYDSLYLRLYTNKLADFNAQKYITAEKCNEQVRVSFDFEGFDLGLYYIVFENKATEEILAVDKFEIVGEDTSVQAEESKAVFVPKLAAPKDLIPNVFLENYINANIAANKAGIEIKTDTTFFYKNGEVYAPIKIGVQKESNPSIRFKLFTNSPADIENDFPLLNRTIDFNDYERHIHEENNRDVLYCPIYANLKVGLYYVVITAPDGKTILAVNKFEVKDRE